MTGLKRMGRQNRNIVLMLSVLSVLGGCAGSSLSDGTGFTEAGSPTVTTATPTASAVGSTQPAAFGDDRDGVAVGAQPAEPVVLPAAARSFAEASTPGTQSYRVGPRDVLEIQVYQVAELSGAHEVGDNGLITLPLIGAVQAGGSTVLDIQNDVRTRLGQDYLQNPQVTVTVKTYNSQRVTIDGAVEKPGVIPLTGQMTLLQAVATAGGLTEMASSELVVFRQIDGNKTMASFDLDAVRTGRAQDPVLQSGDVVIAGSSQFKEALANISPVIGVGRAFVPFF